MGKSKQTMTQRAPMRVNTDREKGLQEQAKKANATTPKELVNGYEKGLVERALGAALDPCLSLS
jgi:hypothetical protein